MRYCWPNKIPKNYILSLFISRLKAPLFVIHPFGVCPFVSHVFLRANNSALGSHRALPKVVNEKYFNIVLIFGVIWGGKWRQKAAKGGKRWQPKIKKKSLFFSQLPIFLAASALRARGA